MVSGSPVIVTFLSVVPSSALAILIAAPDNCLHAAIRSSYLLEQLYLTSCMMYIL
jgi:hypothetical protein